MPATAQWPMLSTARIQVPRHLLSCLRSTRTVSLLKLGPGDATALRPNPLAISLAEAGSFLSCRKRNMLSVLRLNFLGMGHWRFPVRASEFPPLIVDTFSVLPELFS